jgi:hypothetical protein
MFSDEILDRIYQDEEVKEVPIGYQVTIVRAIERILEEEENKNGATLYQS